MKVIACNENWDSMSPNDEGRHCEVCNLTVVNLRNNSLAEIEEIKESKGKVCGRVTKLQLSEFQYLHPMKRFAIALFLVFGTSLFTVSYGQILEEKTRIEQQENRFIVRFTAEKTDGSPLEGVSINFDTEHDYKQGVTDKKGNLTLDFSSTAEEIEVYVNIHFENIYGSLQIKASHEWVNNFDKIIFDQDNYKLIVGDYEFYEEIIMGDIAPIDWIEDSPFEQKTENN